MIPVENFRGYIASIVAGILAIGAVAASVYVWLQPVADPPRDLSVIFAVLGTAAGGATTFLFLQDSAARSSRATERAAEASSGQARVAFRAANGGGSQTMMAPLVENTAAYPPVGYEPADHSNREGWSAPTAATVSAAWPESESTYDAVVGSDRFEGDVEPDQGEKHPDEPQRAMPEGADPEGEEVPENQQQDS